MTELSKELKIVLIINGIAAFIYGFLFLVIPEIYYDLSDEPYPNVHLQRLWGGTITLLGIFALIAWKRGEWETGKIMVELAMGWLLLVCILSLASFAYVKRSPTNIASTWSDVIVTLIFFLMDLYFYLKQKKG
ncbi:MAG: hypothetical protein EU532_04100 [Promethearchaeota archaeon]|nr:MAG: hypothetical protein EU532_04100 [Candidatus Lokiarchaeota archaeon]